MHNRKCDHRHVPLDFAKIRTQIEHDWSMQIRIDWILPTSK